jgi:hypothetical protein
LIETGYSRRTIAIGGIELVDCWIKPGVALKIERTPQSATE